MELCCLGEFCSRRSAWGHLFLFVWETGGFLEGDSRPSLEEDRFCRRPRGSKTHAGYHYWRWQRNSSLQKNGSLPKRKEKKWWNIKPSWWSNLTKSKGKGKSISFAKFKNQLEVPPLEGWTRKEDWSAFAVETTKEKVFFPEILSELIILTSTASSPMPIFEAKVANASACLLCARDTCSKWITEKDQTNFWTAFW